MLKQTSRILWADRRLRYLVVGGFNTLLGYGVFAALYFLASRLVLPPGSGDPLPVWAQYSVLIVANVICISSAWAGYKFLVFRTHGNYLREYFRTYVVYVPPTVIGLGLWAMMVNVGHMNPYLAQAIIMTIVIVMSYLGHKHWTFRPPSPVDPAEATRRRREMARSMVAYVTTVLITVFMLSAALDLPHHDLHIPFQYKGGDGMSVLACAKTIIETGWYYHNPHLGAPGAAEFLDYPQSELFHFAILKLICTLTSSAALAVNLFFLLGFPLAAVSALFALRRFGISRPLGVVGGTLYALQPYHFVRGEMHLFLGNYAIVPLALLVCVALASGVDLRLWGAGSAGAPRRRMLAAMLIVVAITCSGVYYGFFAAFLFFVAGILGAVRLRSFARLVAPAILLAVALITLGANLLPTVVYTHSHGTDRDVANRWSNQAELFSLKITYLLLPNRAHRSPAMQNLFDKYDTTQLVQFSESKMAAIGCLAGAGFIVLIGVVLLRAVGVEIRQPLGHLAALNLAAVLLGTQGGLGSLFSYFVSASLRSYTRISIFIAFLSLAAILILLDAALAPLFRRPGRRLVAFALVCVLTALAMYDQIPMPEMDPPRIAANWNSDDAFVKRIETLVPQRSMIFQLPYDPFPESPPIEELLDYDLFRGYIHSTTLRWTYGAMRGREVDLWQRQVGGMSPQPMVQTLRQRGFAGIYLDRNGYRDSTRLEQALHEACGSDAIVSEDGRLVFFAIRPPAQ